jgi:hypothetical protein
MNTATQPQSNPLFISWGYVLVVIPGGAMWWTVLRAFFMLPSDLAFVALMVPIGVFTWLVTPPPTRPRHEREARIR